MSFYVLYDKASGRVLRTHAQYVLGRDEPVECDEARLLEQVRQDFDPGVELAVARAPREFDPRQRLQRLAIDSRSGACVIERYERKGRKAGS